MTQFLPAIHSFISILIHFAKMHFQDIFVTLLHTITKDMTPLLISRHNSMILMTQIFDALGNENAHYKCNGLEYNITVLGTPLR